MLNRFRIFLFKAAFGNVRFSLWFHSVMVFGAAVWLFFVSGFCFYGKHNLMLYSRLVLHRHIIIFKLILTVHKLFSYFKGCREG